MQTGYLRQDESSHWYLIPSDHIEAFDKISQEIEDMEQYSEKWYDAIDYFIEQYSQYRTGGGIGHLQVIIE